jgi:hypothetical protein
MEAFNIVSSVILIPVGILAILLSIPFGLAKVTKWELIPDHPYHTFMAYTDQNRELRRLQFLSAPIALGMTLVYVDIWGDPNRNLLTDLAFLATFVVFFVYTYWGYFARDLVEKIQTVKFLTIFSGFLLMKLLGIFSFGVLCFYGVVIALYWSGVLFLRKASDQIGNI